jgi:hypothetical protein
MDSTEKDEIGGIIAAFEAQIGERHRPLALIGRFRVRAGAGSDRKGVCQGGGADRN